MKETVLTVHFCEHKFYNIFESPLGSSPPPSQYFSKIR